MLPRATKALLSVSVLSCLVFSACAQTAGTVSDPEALKAKVVGYMGSLFPNLQGLEATAVTKGEGPFYTVEVKFQNRGRDQNTSVHVTEDGKYLLVGQIWDMEIDPNRARWDQRTEGAAERMAQVDLSDRPFKGKADAKVTVVEFSDYQCPFCSRAYAELEGRLMEKYGDKIKLVFKHLPLEQIHPWAKKASVAAACAYQQSPDAFWAIHSKLFENQKQITVDNLRETVEGFASGLNLDTANLLACYDEDATLAVVEADLKEAAAIGVGSTPTFLVNGAIVAGAVPFEEMASYIEFALADAEKE